MRGTTKRKARLAFRTRASNPPRRGSPVPALSGDPLGGIVHTGGTDSMSRFSVALLTTRANLISAVCCTVYRNDNSPVGGEEV